MNNVYEIVTSRIVEEMSKGIIPWQRPWHGTNNLAISYETRKPYSLLNQLILGRPGEWLTFNQIKAIGGSIKKGAKAGMVTFYKVTPKVVTEVVTNEDGEEMVQEKTKLSFILKYYNVFHIEDCDGIQSKSKELPPVENEPIESAENVIGEYITRDKLSFESKKSNKAYYSPTDDKVVVPLLEQFNTTEQYYSTTFHELIHSTGHASRLDRKSGMQSFFGNEDYSKEELVAEIGSAMLCGKMGFETEKTFKNSVAYLQSWIQKLKNDNKMIVLAATAAEKAVKYILNEK